MNPDRPRAVHGGDTGGEAWRTGLFEAIPQHGLTGWMPSVYPWRSPVGSVIPPLAWKFGRRTVRLPKRALRRLGILITVMGGLAAALMFTGTGTSREALRGTLETAAHELSTWLAVGAVTAPPLIRYELEIEPELRRAAELPSGAPIRGRTQSSMA